MKVIGHQEIEGLHLDPAIMWDWVDDALRHKSEMLMPAKISIHPGEDRFWNTMPIVMPTFGIGGVKLVNRYPGRTPALDAKILLYSTETGKPLALIDGNYITTMRTGAVAVHSADLLAVPGYQAIAIVGLGNTARAAMLVMAHRHPDRKFDIRLVKYKNQHRLFSERFSGYPNLRFSYCDSLEEAVAGAKVVFSAVTVFHDDVVSPEVFEPGTTLIPIHTRGYMQADLVFDRIYGDELSQIEDFKYFDRFPNFAEVAEVLTKKKPGRTSLEERILVYNIGIVAHDLYFANKILKLMSDTPSVSLSEPEGKFWV
ncbi:ornithine cyclodeaminase [Varibaculum vaginae]|uniref:ornithine cyclodeaminase n=1 Tax=Varibaculum vaginae TaxID=2364797 RepID=UPI000F08DE7F|nr:ornithine cyclodeaminase [Varibaculum vaginae]